jgi:hypothetical protein
VRKVKKGVDRKTLEKEAVFWNGIKKTLGKNATKKCHK